MWRVQQPDSEKTDMSGVQGPGTSRKGSVRGLWCRAGARGPARRASGCAPGPRRPAASEHSANAADASSGCFAFKTHVGSGESRTAFQSYLISDQTEGDLPRQLPNIQMTSGCLQNSDVTLKDKDLSSPNLKKKCLRFYRERGIWVGWQLPSWEWSPKALKQLSTSPCHCLT